MDFQGLADALYAPTCIVSVERTKDGGCGELRLVAANQKYIDMIDMRMEREAEKVKADRYIGFVPGSLYTDYFPINRSFETVCYRAAIEKTEVHTYAHLNTVDVWFDIYVMPVDYEDNDTFYCTYSVNLNKNPDAILDTVNTSQTSNDVLKTCIQLHKADNLKDAMKSVIAEIRRICNAEGCTVLLINYDEAQYSILATDYVENSAIKRVTSFTDFYKIAASWEEMIGDEGDCIIIKDEADMEYVKSINNPWYLTLVEAGVRSVVLFPLRQGNELLGFIWATNFDTEKTIRIKETLELTTFFISAHIAQYKALTRLKHMSYTDAMTGLPNRFACTEYISDLVSKGEKFALVSIDLNHFKSINDTLGLEAGNRVLIEIANRWKEACDDHDSDTENYITRISGDEFFLVISGYDSQEELKSLIDRYVDVMSERLTVEGCDLYVTASFGYTEFPMDADNVDALISHANAAMNEIKKANSSEHVLRFTRDLLQNEHILEVENLIRTALDNDTVYFNLQPQYDMDHRLRGFEALARMKDKDGKNVSPGEFIPVAEKVGLIDRVDGAVFRKAALFFGELLRKTDSDLMLSINASVRHLMKNDFLDEIGELLKISGIPADKLEIEITESIMIDSVDKALQCIDELKSMGIKIAIDDFGTGYSSLSYINRFPADLLKIDKSFIDEMNTSDSSGQYVAAIISMGHIMGFDVISEGVEEQEQLDTLKSIGCDYIQGFIWGRPMSAQDAENLVLNSIT
jgi:diguanylate cyclase (GGDEF)-like protein